MAATAAPDPYQGTSNDSTIITREEPTSQHQQSTARGSSTEGEQDVNQDEQQKQEFRMLEEGEATTTGDTPTLSPFFDALPHQYFQQCPQSKEGWLSTQGAVDGFDCAQQEFPLEWLNNPLFYQTPPPPPPPPPLSSNNN